MKYLDFEGSKLDLTYITSRLVVMGSPFKADNTHALRRYLEVTHGGRYRIFNFTIEREFNLDQDYEHVITYPIIRGTPCALKQLISICKAIEGFLLEHDDHVVILHSSQGHRAAHIAAAYLLHCGQVEHASSALEAMQAARGQCLTIPSQIRYIFYYEKMLRTDRILLSTFRLVHVKMITIPSFNASLVHSGCSPYLEIYLDGHRNVHSGSPQHCLTRVHSAVEFTPNVLIRGDVCVSVHSEGVKMAQVVFNTSFVDNGYLLFARDVVDMVPKDFNTFAEGFAIELTMERASDLPELNAELSEEVTAEPTMINDYEQEEQ